MLTVSDNHSGQMVSGCVVAGAEVTHLSQCLKEAFFVFLSEIQNKWLASASAGDMPRVSIDYQPKTSFIILPSSSRGHCVQDY